MAIVGLTAIQARPCSDHGTDFDDLDAERRGAAAWRVSEDKCGHRYHPQSVQPVERDNSIHVCQIWRLPSEQGVEPSYEQRPFDEPELPIDPTTHTWGQVLRSSRHILGIASGRSDGIAASEENSVSLSADEDCGVVLSDLASRSCGTRKLCKGGER